MADFDTPRHNAVMERLRRRIELFRQHHNSCESRYGGAALERLELDRQQTLQLHQRCLQTKAKRAGKTRQAGGGGGAAGGDPAGQRAPGGGGGGGAGGGGAEPGEPAEQSRNSTLIALQETVKRKLESAGSPLSREQVNGYGDGFPPSKKSCLDNGTANGSPLDSKSGVVGDALGSNGTHGPPGEPGDAGAESGSDFHRKEMKQEPEDIQPIMPPAMGGNISLFPELNLNEQEWKELMEELNNSVPIDDIQDIISDTFGDSKDRLELAAPPGGAEAGPAQGLTNVKAEFSPAPPVFEDSRTGSPHVRSTSSGPPPHPTSSPAAASSASSPALPSSQPAPPPRQLQPPPNHLIPPGPKDLSPAQQLQQLAAQQQRAQHLHGKMQHKPPPPGAKFHQQGPHPHPPWPPMANASQGALGGSYGMDKPTSPSLYPQDFNPPTQKQLLMPAQAKSAPKTGPGGYHPNMMGQLSAGLPLSHPGAAAAGGAPGGMLSYSNTKPLSHFEVPNNQNKEPLLALIRQQQLKTKGGMGFPPHMQDQNYSAPPHGPGTNAMAPGPRNNPMAAQAGPNAMASNHGNAMAGNHGNAAYLSSQAAALKHQQQQQQLLEQQKKQQQFLQQRQQLLAEQEKQRQQQDQQLQRHLTRPPPQYQDQTGPPANQNPFPQQPGQFTASNQPIGNGGSMRGPAPGSRMFSQAQGMLGMSLGQGGGPGGGVAPPPAVSQSDISMSSCGGGGGGAGVEVLYNMNMHPGHAPQGAGLQRQPLGGMSAAYRQNLLAQQHLKTQPNAAMLKQQQQQQLAAARLPTAMGAGLVPGGQGGPWQQQQQQQQQLAGQPPNAFSNSNAFHMQQPRMSKMAAGAVPFGPGGGGRPLAALNPRQQQMMQQQQQQQQQQRAPPAAQQQQQQQPANQSQPGLPDLVAFGPAGGGGRQALQCNQGYQMSRGGGQQQQQVSFGYNVEAGSFAAESELVDSLLKGQSSQEWMAELDELLANHQ